MRPTILLAVLAAIASPALAQTRVTQSTSATEDGSRMMIHEVVIDAPAAEVWQAISTAEGWRTWAVPAAWDERAERQIIVTSLDANGQRGGRGNIRHEIVASVPERILAFRTTSWPDSFRPGPVLRDIVWVFELQPVRDSTTLVRLTGVGFGQQPLAEEAHSFYMRINTLSLQNLSRRFVEGPRPWRTGSRNEPQGSAQAR